MISDLRNLSTDDQQIYDPFIPGIIDTFLKSRMNVLKNEANNTFLSFFPQEIPKYFRPNFYNTQFVTNHGNFKSFLNRIKAVEDSSCFCGMEEQTSRHLLIDCPAFQDYRMKNELACTIDDLERSGRPRMQRTQAAIKAIRERIRRNPHCKQKILAKQINLAPR
ncbi:hypothetical protein LAZ67_1002201 [Cordylochernes scorpioides]|uniref:Reverse transcriptase zinc-binding domain-containing protein n=1 Tax=Cordylochernes scorpioides TaxID=51811 RepID=A0ABY6JXJ2_9ARAC|nr:hypothetical protein LAZ67_1002201 [Cordylochernes scorpioides]